MNIEEAVSCVVGQVRKSGNGVAEAVKKLWGSHLSELADLDREQLAQEGLGHRVQHILTSGGLSDGREVSVKVRFSQTELPPEEAIRLRILASTSFVMPDGKSHSLLHFTVEDFYELIQENKQQISGLARRNKVFASGIETLRRHGVEEIAMLPKEQLMEFASEWEQATK